MRLNLVYVLLRNHYKFLCLFFRLPFPEEWKERNVALNLFLIPVNNSTISKKTKCSG